MGGGPNPHRNSNNCKGSGASIHHPARHWPVFQLHNHERTASNSDRRPQVLHALTGQKSSTNWIQATNSSLRTDPAVERTGTLTVQDLREGSEKPQLERIK